MNELFNLKGRVALITGGSKGLGKAMARALADAGADITISSRHENELQAALKEITAGTSVRGNYCVADMCQRSEPARLAAFAIEKMGRVDILVNNAGSNVPQTLEQIRDEDWDKIIE